mgnify:FL=1
MTEILDFEFERKFLLKNDTSFPNTNGYFIFQAFPYLDDSCGIRVRMEASLQSVEHIIRTHGLNLKRSDDVAYLIEHCDCSEDSLLTIKESGGGCSGVRYEKETTVSTNVVRSILMHLAHSDVSAIILKERYSHIVSFQKRTWSWEIDVFQGFNAPLVLAECEDAAPVTDLFIPKFCEREVTGDIQFTNAYLAVHPFSTWANRDSVLSSLSFSNEFGTNTFEATDGN